MKQLLIGVLTTLIISNCYGQSSDTLKNDDIIKMYQSGLSKEVILKKIETASAKQFDLSTDALIKLKKVNIPDTILLAIMEQPQNGNEYVQNRQVEGQRRQINEGNTAAPFDKLSKEGLYFYDTAKGAFVSVPNNKSTRFMMDGKTYMTGGFSSKKEYQFPNTEAVVQLNTNSPEFYLKIDGIGSMLEPNNFILFKGEIVKRKGVRKALWTGAGITDNNKLSRNAMKPDLERLTDQVYKFTFPKGLGNGCYFLGPRDNPHTVCFDFDIVSASKKPSAKNSYTKESEEEKGGKEGFSKPRTRPNPFRKKN